ncbi:MAG: hypothetical protein EXR36_07160 [Betaproteobacteria bacterium]|nr:hypothetical protein [Betaproteobacteria bacterium]
MLNAVGLPVTYRLPQRARLDVKQIESGALYGPALSACVIGRSTVCTKKVVTVAYAPLAARSCAGSEA